MSDGSLSQDEIEALLQGADDAFSTADTGPAVSGGGMGGTGGGGSLSASQKATFLDVVKLICEHQAFSLSSISTKNVTITNPNLNEGSAQDLQGALNGQVLEARIGYSGSVTGNAYYYMTSEAAASIAGLMMGQDDSELSEMSLQALNEAFSQMTGAADSAVSNKYGGNFSNQPPALQVLSSPAEASPSGGVVYVTANLTVEGTIQNAPYVLAFDTSFAQGIVATVTGGGGGGMDMMGGGDDDIPGLDSLVGESPGQEVQMRPADFGTLSPAADIQPKDNLGLLYDVEMEMTVELGRSKMNIRDILGLGEGSIIELQKLAGEPVDLLVNGKLIAKGEVVVIDENFGVRVTEIVNPMDRVTGTKTM